MVLAAWLWQGWFMSLLPPQAIQEFQALWKQRYGVDLSAAEATERAHQVFALVRLLVQPPPANSEEPQLSRNLLPYDKGLADTLMQEDVSSPASKPATISTDSMPQKDTPDDDSLSR
jgi:hypothetical protein